MSYGFSNQLDGSTNNALSAIENVLLILPLLKIPLSSAPLTVKFYRSYDQGGTEPTHQRRGTN
ncbi:MAG: hypothetical protein IPP46_06040 [Bacteroidetes bacterium]|nr:hypothetical protein [Bacteroidota bacterium]